MAIDKAKAFLRERGMEERVLKFETSSVTVELAAQAVDGVCTFALNEGVDAFLDESLRCFDTVYPTAGNAASAVRLAPDELERCAVPCAWVDVCKVV